MSEQIKEFTRGFEQELDFNHEADVQTRFFERSLDSQTWFVPRLFESSGRVLEMEYLQDASAINHAIGRYRGKQRTRFQRKLAENFLYTMLEHLLIYQEFHGDLHPGNIMADMEARLFLIDWGNAVDMKGKWGLLGQYIVSVISGDIDDLTDTLIEMSTEDNVSEARYLEIKTALAETLSKKNITALKRDFMLQMYREGREGFHKRLQTALHLMSNTYQLGITIKSDYLHLSRSLFAMAGTYNNLYDDIPRWVMAKDFVLDVVQFPLKYTWNHISSPSFKIEKAALRHQSTLNHDTVALP